MEVKPIPPELHALGDSGEYSKQLEDWLLQVYKAQVVELMLLPEPEVHHSLRVDYQLLCHSLGGEPRRSSPAFFFPSSSYPLNRDCFAASASPAAASAGL